MEGSAKKIKLNEGVITSADVERWRREALPSHERARLEKPCIDDMTDLARSTGMVRDDWVGNERRVESDPLFCFYCFPDATVVVDGEEIPIIDKFLSDVMEYVRDGYGIDTASSPYVARGFQILGSTDDIVIKRWAAWKFIIHIPEAREWMEGYYEMGNPEHQFRGVEVFRHMCEVAKSMHYQDVLYPVSRENSAIFVTNHDKTLMNIWALGFCK